MGRGPRAVTVNTCTADHPRALPTYLRAGFHPIRQVREEWDVPCRLGLEISARPSGLTGSDGPAPGQRGRQRPRRFFPPAAHFVIYGQTVNGCTLGVATSHA